MSTKTTFKRIALVAVAALGLGVLAAVPSSAAPTAAYSSMYDATNGVAIVGGQATVTFTVDTSTTNTFSWSGVGTVLKATDNGGTSDFEAYSGTEDSNIINNPTSGTLVATVNSSGTGTVAFLLTSSAAGTQTISVTPVGSSGIPGAAVTKSVTWVATSYTANAGYSTSYLGTASASTAVDAAAAAAFVPYAASTANTIAAQISTTIKSDVNADLNGVAITYAITSGPGLLSAINVGDNSTSDGTAVGRSLSKTATEMASANTSGITVIADGTAGTSTITVTAGTVVIKTFTLYFVGAATKYTTLVAKNTLRVGSNVGATATSAGSADYVVRVKVEDANGNRVVSGTTVYAESSKPLVATITGSATTGATGYAYFDVTGVIAGEGVKFTFRNASTAAAATVTAESTAVDVTSSSIATLSMKFDKASYVPGEKMTLSITALNAAGKPVADYGTTATGDGVYTNVFAAAATANAAITGTLPGTGLATTDGVAEYTMYAPLIPGDVTVSSGLMVFSSTAAQYATKLTATAKVEGGASLEAAQAAADAAAEATDAANAATDAANAAAEAADAATAAAQDAADAVAALSTQVSEMVNALKKQITALTNLVIKIQRKVKA